jgi:hypothetical protein
VPVTATVKVSQVTFSTQFDSELTLGPGLGGMPWVQEELGPPGAGPTEPEDGLGPVDGSEEGAGPREKIGLLCVPAPTSDVAQSRAKLLMTKSIAIAARAVVELEDFLFIFSSNLQKANWMG